MIELGYFPEVGDEFSDLSDGTTITITSVDMWAREVGVTRRTPGLMSFTFEVLPEEDLKTAVDCGFLKQIGSKQAELSGNCWHSWDTYVGFSWTYKFCSKCGIKKDGIK